MQKSGMSFKSSPYRGSRGEEIFFLYHCFTVLSLTDCSEVMQCGAGVWPTCIISTLRLPGMVGGLL